MTSFIFDYCTCATKRAGFWNISLFNILSELRFVIIWQRLKSRQVRIFRFRRAFWLFFSAAFTSVHLAFLWKLVFPYLTFSFLSCTRTLRPLSSPAFQSGSFINASLILAGKRLVRPSIPRGYTTLSSFPSFQVPFVSYPHRFSVSSRLPPQMLLTFYPTHTRTCTHIHQPDSFRRLFRLLR